MRFHTVLVLMIAYIAFEEYVLGTTLTKYEEKQVTIKKKCYGIRGIRKLNCFLGIPLQQWFSTRVPRHTRVP